MQKKKSGVKKCLEICAIKGGGGGGGPLMANAILNFHFDYLNPSLSSVVLKMTKTQYVPRSSFAEEDKIVVESQFQSTPSFKIPISQDWFVQICIYGSYGYQETISF